MLTVSQACDRSGSGKRQVILVGIIGWCGKRYPEQPELRRLGLLLWQCGAHSGSCCQLKWNHWAAIRGVVTIAGVRCQAVVAGRAAVAQVCPVSSQTLARDCSTWCQTGVPGRLVVGEWQACEQVCVGVCARHTLHVGGKASPEARKVPVDPPSCRGTPCRLPDGYGVGMRVWYTGE